MFLDYYINITSLICSLTRDQRGFGKGSAWCLAWPYCLTRLYCTVNYTKLIHTKILSRGLWWGGGPPLCTPVILTLLSAEAMGEGWGVLHPTLVILTLLVAEARLRMVGESSTTL